MSNVKERALELYPIKERKNDDGITYDANFHRRKAFIKGWAEAMVGHGQQSLWKDAQGDFLPDFDKEVIALVGMPSFMDPTEYYGYKLVFAHRPNPEGYSGKSITTGKTEHYIPQCYDKGGWNQPHVLYWLAIHLPKKLKWCKS